MIAFKDLIYVDDELPAKTAKITKICTYTVCDLYCGIMMIISFDVTTVLASCSCYVINRYTGDPIMIVSKHHTTKLYAYK